MKKKLISVLCFILFIVNVHSLMWNEDKDDVEILNYFYTDSDITNEHEQLVEEIVCNELPVKDYFEEKVGRSFYLVKKYNSIEDLYKENTVESWYVKFSKNNVVAFSYGELLLKIYILNNDGTLEIFECDWEM